MEYEYQKRAILVIKQAMRYVEDVHNKAESKHDNYGEYYMDGAQYEIMQETESLLEEMKAIIANFEST